MDKSKRVAIIIVVIFFVALITLVAYCGAMCGNEVADILIEGVQ